MRFRISISICFVIIFIVGCKSSKDSYMLSLDDASSKSLLLNIQTTNSDIENVYIKRCNFQIKTNKSDNNLGGSIFIKPDSFIILSIQALLGIEVARAKFSRQNIIIIDRLNKSVITKTYKDIGIKYGFDLTYKNLELLLLNQPFDLDTNPQSIDYKEYISSVVSNHYLLKSKNSWGFFSTHNTSNINQEFTISSPPNKLLKNDISIASSSSVLQILYDDFESVGDHYFPRELSCFGKKGDLEIHINIKFSNILFGVSSGLNFTIPNSYEKLPK